MTLYFYEFAHFFVMYFLGTPWTLDWNKSALSLQMFLPLALQQQFGTTILLVRAWDLLEFARGHVLLFGVCVLIYDV